MEDLSGISLALFTRVLGWDVIELELYLKDVKAEWHKKGVHAYYPMQVLQMLEQKYSTNSRTAM